MHLNGQTFSSVFELFSFISRFLGLKMQKSIFKEKMVLRVVFFIKLTFRWLQTGLPDLKNTKQLNFCLLLFFQAFFKCYDFFKIVRDFLNSSVFPGKIVKCT